MKAHQLKTLAAFTSLAVAFSAAVPSTSALTVPEAITSIQSSNPTLPTGVPNPKGNIGFLLANMFWSASDVGYDSTKFGKIKPTYFDGAGATAWTYAGGNTYLTDVATGNVGIWTNVPNATLEIKRSASDSNFAAWIEGLDGANYWLGVNIANTWSGRSIADFRSGNSSRLFVRADGNVGVGTSSPDRKLQISRGSATSSIRLDGFTSPGQFTNLFSSYWWALSDFGSLIEGADNGQIVVALKDNDGNDGLRVVSGGGNFMSDGIYDTSVLTALPNGNVGIGTGTPGARLEVAWQIKITWGAPAVGKILTSDISGLASWESPSSVFSESDPKVGTLTNGYVPVWNSGSLANTNMYANISNGNWGIGHTGGRERLDVAGNMVLSSGNIFLSHDSTTNTNNDYIKIDDTNGIELGWLGGAFSVHVDSPRWLTWTGANAAIAAGGGYFAKLVGIGTTAPAATLEAKRWTDDANYAAWFEGTKTNNYGLGVNIANTSSGKSIADFKSWNVSRMVVKGDGNVGIGNAAPAYALDVTGNVNMTGNVGIGSWTPILEKGINLDIDVVNNTGYGLYSNVTSSWTFTANRSYFGTYNIVTNAAENAGFTASAFGSYNYALNTTSATGTGAKNLYGSYSYARNYNTWSTIANAYGGYFTVWNTYWTITNGYGVFIGNVDGAAATTYGLYQSDAAGKNYFAGSLGVGNNAPEASFEVKRTAVDSNYVWWFEGANVNNYGLGVNILNTSSNRSIANFQSANVSRLFVRGDGNVGIGTSAPGAKLEVAGQVKITGGSPGAGKVLTSDASGLATWTTPASGGGITAATTASCGYSETTPSCTATCPAGYFRTGCSAGASNGGGASPSWSNACTFTYIAGNWGNGYAYCAK